MNNVSLIGRLTHEAEMKYTQSGDAIASFTIRSEEHTSELQSRITI